MTKPQQSSRTFTDMLAALDHDCGSAGKSQPPVRVQKPSGSPGRARPTSEDEFLTVAEVALILRFVERHVRKLIDDGELMASRFGCAVRIRRVDLDDYITRCSKPRARKSNRD